MKMYTDHTRVSPLSSIIVFSMSDRLRGYRALGHMYKIDGGCLERGLARATITLCGRRLTQHRQG
jgi:hypothetical protein